jgi:hypothetical protein
MEEKKHTIFSREVKENFPIHICWNEVRQLPQTSYEQSGLVRRLVSALLQRDL